jgi:hypothetical protein
MASKSKQQLQLTRHFLVPPERPCEGLAKALEAVHLLFRKENPIITIRCLGKPKAESLESLPDKRPSDSTLPFDRKFQMRDSPILQATKKRFTSELASRSSFDIVTNGWEQLVGSVFWLVIEQIREATMDVHISNHRLYEWKRREHGL